MMIENELIELSNQMKEIVDGHEKQSKIYKQKYMDLKKTIAHIYGLIRQTYEMEDPLDDGVMISYLIHEVRSICSNILFIKEEDALGLLE
tara:strand:- start:912 stop:1181 length:270 start_codon:yes stop_codon:yes gene_type:complete